ncbi:MAG: hypothetical protein IJS87_05140, partial [Rhodocyclaceae bacterium]|nr:hypothetical protein [Rhodocyclaceae bacterium]
RLGLCDLDIINPYFRSRERRAMLEAAGIPVYGSAYGHEVTAELPELAANVRARSVVMRVAERLPQEAAA